MSKLKPCPFCGGEATFHTYGRTCNVVCDDCLIGTRLEHIDEYEVAIDAWNTRADSIVRCRDCRWYSEHMWVVATDVADVCEFWHGEPTKVEPDGFCKWGEAR